MSLQKSPIWLRAIQIGLGILILLLFIIVLIYPILGGITLIFFIAFLLFFAGIEKIISGITGSGKSRFSGIGLGIIVVILSIIALIFPIGASNFVIILLGVALLVDGVSRIVHSIRHKEGTGWSNKFGIGVGILSIILAIIVIIYPTIGQIFAGILIGIALLITAIQIISAGVTGFKARRRE